MLESGFLLGYKNETVLFISIEIFRSNFEFFQFRQNSKLDISHEIKIPVFIFMALKNPDISK